MKIPSVVPTLVSGLCLLLTVWLFTSNSANQSLQADLQQKQQEIQTEQMEVQLQQQQLQSQQEQLNSAVKLAQEIGPAVLKDLGSVAVQNKNQKIKELLSKYGITIKEEAPAAGATTPVKP